MIEGATTAGTQVAAGPSFPPFKVESFPSQIFWLVVTMGILFVVLWRFIGPRIGGTLADRKGMIRDELDTAQENRRKAEQATVAYETPLFEARERARAINNRYRDEAASQIKKAQGEADALAEKATAEAEERLVRLRAEAKVHIARAAGDAVVDIVSRLTGERISPEDAAAAVRAVQEA